MEFRHIRAGEVALLQIHVLLHRSRSHADTGSATEICFQTQKTGVTK